LSLASWAQSFVDRLVAPYGAPRIPVVLGCERACPYARCCPPTDACFIYSFIGVKSYVSPRAMPYVLAHEAGHYIYHYVNRLRPFSDARCDRLACEAFAESFASPWRAAYERAELASAAATAGALLLGSLLFTLSTR
jgi:hypothetical protein